MAFTAADTASRELLQQLVGITTFLSCFVLFRASHIIFSRTSPGYRALDRGKQAEFNSRTVSSLHALVTAGAALYVTMQEGSNLFVPRHTSPAYDFWKLTMAFSFGYSAFDMLLVLHEYATISQPLPTLLHHLSMLTAMGTIFVSDLFVGIGVLCFLFEFSTPLVNVFWTARFFSWSEQSKIVSGLLMTLSFFLCRILVNPLIVYHVLLRWKEAFEPETGFVPVWCVAAGSTSVFLLLNVWWFSTMIRGIMSKLSASAKEAKKSASVVPLKKVA
jgi:hypothetical protein